MHDERLRVRKYVLFNYPPPKKNVCEWRLRVQGSLKYEYDRETKARKTKQSDNKGTRWKVNIRNNYLSLSFSLSSRYANKDRQARSGFSDIRDNSPAR